MDKLITLLDLAKKQPSFQEEPNGWKLIVHTSPHVNLPELVYSNLDVFEYFQQDQSGAVYNCERIISTVKLSSRTALVIGAYEVGKQPLPLDLDAINPPEQLARGYESWRSEVLTKAPLRYSLERKTTLDNLAFRVVIEVPARGMKLNSIDREVVGLREAGSIGPCPDYADLDISVALLQAVYANPGANPSWQQRLSAVGGIYLLTDHLNQRLYVGKTDARRGFWERWRAYANQRTGNKFVDPAFESGELRADCTSMSILEVVPRGSANERVIEKLEQRWMRRLLSRETGYNAARVAGRAHRDEEA